jgi:hypothetical protein
LLSFLESRAGVTFDSANQRIVLYALHPKELVSKPTKSLSDARVQLSFLAKHFQSAFRAESASNAVDWISADQKMLDSLLLPELAKDFADAHLSLETSKLGPFAKRDSVIRYFVRVLREGKSFPLLGNNARALAFNFLLQHPGGDSLMYRILSERKPAPPRKPPAPRRYKPQKLPEHYRPGRV